MVTQAPLRAISMLHPGKIICVGLNYRDHATEAGASLPSAPLLFAKLTSSVVGPNEVIVLPQLSVEVDYEAELGVVIGTSARRVSVDNALDIVAGYVCVNDVTARDIQLSDGQWMRGKSIDTFCPIGPEIVPRAAIPDPQQLRIRCLLNGEIVQDSSTAQMIFSVRELISFISASITLEPGDLIATGTPAGVGLAKRPPRYLRPGDEIAVEIDGIGRLTNRVVADRAAHDGMRDR